MGELGQAACKRITYAWENDRKASAIVASNPAVVKSFGDFVIAFSSFLKGYTVEQLKGKAVETVGALLLPEDMEFPSEWEEYRREKATELVVEKLLDKAMEMGRRPANEVKKLASEYCRKNKPHFIRVVMRKIRFNRPEYDYTPEKFFSSNNDASRDIDEFYQLAGRNVSTIKESLITTYGTVEKFRAEVKDTDIRLAIEDAIGGDPEQFTKVLKKGVEAVTIVMGSALGCEVAGAAQLGSQMVEAADAILGDAIGATP